MFEKIKKFLAAAFHITIFQVVFVLALAGLKYWMNTSGLAGRLFLPVAYLGIGAFLLMLVSIGIQGHLDNQGYAIERWLEERPGVAKRIWVARFVHWGQVLPLLLFYAVGLYLITPTSLLLGLAFFVGIVIRNIIRYLFESPNARTETST